MAKEIIGLVGPSCSGKSTLARELAASLQVPLLQLDGRYVKGYRRPIVNGFESFEQPGLYDSATLAHELDDTLRGHDTVIVEGFLLLSYPHLADRFTVSFYLDVPHDELVRRRKARVASGGDKVWGANGGKPEADAGWLAHGREEWERFGAPQAARPGVIILDGLLPVADNVRRVLSHLAARTGLGHPVQVPVA